MTAAEIEDRFGSRGVAPPEFRDVPDEEGSIHLALHRHGEAEATALFVHGSPGSWDNFIGYFLDEELREEFQLASVDRPGFGRSLPRRAEPSMRTQARRIHDALTKAGIVGNVIAVGHSLGGPVVLQLAIDYPTFVSGLVLVAPSLDPELEKLRWYNYAARFPPIRWGLSQAWESSNEEIFPHRRELQELGGQLSRVTCPIIVIQGMRDKLVPPGNADYAERMLTTADPLEIWRIQDLNHFVPWTRPDLLARAIRELAEGD